MKLIKRGKFAVVWLAWFGGCVFAVLLGHAIVFYLRLLWQLLREVWP